MVYYSNKTLEKGKIMIHYHGSPLGGNNQDKARFYHGRHALIPFTYTDDLGVISEVCQSFCFDNGAFSAWKKGVKIDFEKYYQWVDDYKKHPGFDFALLPDVIDGSEEQNDSMLHEAPKELLSFLVPVWHMHETFERFDRLASEFKTVAVGSSGAYPTPGANVWWERMRAFMEHICDDKGRPPCRIHGLRMLNPKIFTKLPLASADSTNAATKVNLNQHRFGQYKPAKGWQRAVVVADRTEAFNSASFWGADGFEYENCNRDYFDPQET